MIAMFIGMAAAGAFWGLMVALGLRWARKQRELPTWPIVSGVLRGRLGAVVHGARSPS